MKLHIFSENHRSGLEVDWPAIPREGDLVAFDHRGGTDNYKVERVTWRVDTDGKFVQIEVQLTL